MNPDDRRAALIDATLPLLREHGRGVTTRHIANAAGVAEGTIFRVFASKEELVEAALAKAFESGTFIHELDAVDRDAPLRERMIQVVTILQRRFTDIFGLMRAVGMVGPPDHDSKKHAEARAEIHAELLRIVGPGDELTITPAQFLHVIRLLTFAGSHKEIADGDLLTPEQIVDVLLDGALKNDRKSDA